MQDIFIFDAIRTPRAKGDVQGSLYEVKPVDLFTVLLKAILSRNAISSSIVDDLIVGCVTPVGEQGGNIAKAALQNCDWDYRTGGTQINRFCSSGLDAVCISASKIASNWENVNLAGGIECMSRIVAGIDGGALLYDPSIISNSGYMPQGVAADLIATLYNFNQTMLNDYAHKSHLKAIEATKKKTFENSIIPITNTIGLSILNEDELINHDIDVEALNDLEPQWKSIGEMGFDDIAIRKYPSISKISHLHTKGNAAPCADGAALLLLGNEFSINQFHLAPKARIIAFATISTEPTLCFDGATAAALKVLNIAKLNPSQIDLWEVNEPFAAVALKFIQDLKIDSAKVNINGGAIAYGHPLGATGAILVGSMIDALRNEHLKTGLIAVAAPGGMGTAMIIELLK
ncbi:MAG: acetyl-CoA C-acyltransferase [Saprospiraceae bacterium]|nr:acetyl-CoA C-acyltransferase [Saprospiraceae bacterium]